MKNSPIRKVQGIREKIENSRRCARRKRAGRLDLEVFERLRRRVRLDLEGPAALRPPPAVLAVQAAALLHAPGLHQDDLVSACASMFTSFCDKSPKRLSGLKFPKAEVEYQTVQLGNS